MTKREFFFVSPFHVASGGAWNGGRTGSRLVFTAPSSEKEGGAAAPLRRRRRLMVCGKQGPVRAPWDDLRPCR